MADEVQTPQEQTPELSPEMQEILSAKAAEIEAKYQNELRGLNRTITNYKKEIDEKTLAGKSVEERIAAIEADRQRAQQKMATMEAFSRAGLSEDWRGLFDVSDPEDRANTLKSLLEDYSKGIQKKTASQFIREPSEGGEGGGQRTYTVAQLKGLSAEEINKLWNEGRVKGA
jgi:predicted  nucleic acid-binding Zn-ribbon protein